MVTNFDKSRQQTRNNSFFSQSEKALEVTWCGDCHARFWSQ